MVRRFTLYGGERYGDNEVGEAPSFDPKIEYGEVIAVIEELPVRRLISVLETIAKGECRNYSFEAKEALRAFDE